MSKTITEEFTAEPVRAAWANRVPKLTEYYDREWGMPVTDEAGLFEYLTLEIFQSGLSWITVLNRRDGFRKAFRGFDPGTVAKFDAADEARLLEDPTIIRNRRKIAATIQNARATQALQASGTSLPALLWSYMPESSPRPEHDKDVPKRSPESTLLSQDLKQRGFKYVGPTTAYSLMCAVGIVDAHLLESHRRGCSGLWNADGTRSAQGERIGKMVGFTKPTTS